jgi:predicted NAD/FAD-binding protein
MSFGVSVDNGMFEWGSHSIRSFCHSFRLLFTLWFWRILFDIVRFSLFADEILTIDQSTSVSPKLTAQLSSNLPGRSQDESHLESIGTYMKRQRYSRQFIRYVLIPMVAAPWRIDPDEFAHTFPAHKLVKFM